MNRMIRKACAVAGGMLLMAACAETEDVSYAVNERMALHEWMRLNRPELLGNYQSEGGYYVDVLEPGSEEAAPIRNRASWVRFTFTGRNLAGDIVLTRNEVDARQVGSYTPFTRYVPFYKYYAGDTNGSLLEGTYLAMHNPLTLGAEYAAAHGYPAQIEMRYGTKVTLYMPSSVVSASGVGGSGGYEGQGGYELRSGQPFIVTMQITDTVRNPLEREGSDVDRFASRNGSLKLPPPDKKQAVLSQEDPIPPIYDKDDPYNDGFAWHYVDEDIPQVYVNLIYEPTTKFDYAELYESEYAPYDDFAQLEQNIADTLVNRFGPYEGPTKLPKDNVTVDGTAKIWYIGRFLDGFIFDTNIPGVRRLVYGETATEGEPLTYTPRNGGMIEAFYLAVPNLIYGQWAALLTISTYAYGAKGIAGKTNTSTSGGANYNELFNYYNAMNSMYNYGNYYDSYYGGYMSGQFANNLYYNPGETTTTTSVSTEIPPFTPLLFEFYIEPKEKK